jgi:fumarate hydratase subunit beta
MIVKEIRLPLAKVDYLSLNPDDKVLLTGVLYTARDQAHKRIVEYLDAGKELSFALQDAVIFYAGPSPARPGQICGAIGPTTSARMDKYTPLLLEHGVKILIGKGERSQEVLAAISNHRSVYLSAVGGAAALLSQCVTACEPIAWQDLGAEAVYKLSVKNFPCYVTAL